MDDQFIDMEKINSLKDLGTRINKDLLSQIIKLYRDTTPSLLLNLKSAFENEQLEEVGKIAHKLKSSCGNLGLISMHKLFEDIESQSETITTSSIEMESNIALAFQMNDKAMVLLDDAEN